MYLGGTQAPFQAQQLNKNIKLKETKAATKKQQPKADQMSELVEGLEERRQFLIEMQEAGMGEKYEAQIKGEIAGCLREIELLQGQSSAWEADDHDL